MFDNLEIQRYAVTQNISIIRIKQYSKMDLKVKKVVKTVTRSFMHHGDLQTKNIYD